MVFLHDHACTHTILTPEGIASLEYPAAVLGSKRIVVMVHSSGGAVDAAIQCRNTSNELSGSLPMRLDQIIIRCTLDANPDDPDQYLADAVTCDADKGIEQLINRSSVPAEAVKSGKLETIAGVRTSNQASSPSPSRDLNTDQIPPRGRGTAVPASGFMYPEEVPVPAVPRPLERFTMAILSPPYSACTALLLSLALTPLSLAQDSTAPATSSDELMNDMITTLDPCAGSPNEAVCRCALEFPPVTYDTSVPLVLVAGDTSPNSIATGRTLMNLIRATVVSIAPNPDAEPPIRLYVNPPATPDPGPALEKLVHTNPAFKDLKLVEVLMLPRHLGQEADRLFGSIWLHPPTRTLVIAFRGTQTPFEFHLDTLVDAHRTVDSDGKTRLIAAEGFATGYLMMRETILSTLRSYQDQATKILVTGHSLGGAIAAIAVMDLEFQQSTRVIGMTFGQPRVFSPTSADLVNEFRLVAHQMHIPQGIIRVVCESDPIPNVPPAAVTGDGVKFKHTTSSVTYFDDPSATPGKGAEWNHHFYYDGYFDDEKTAQFGSAKLRKVPEEK